MALKLIVRAFWDHEAGVWVAESEDVPGLATEAPTMEELISKLKVMIPELLALNLKETVSESEVPVEILSQRVEMFRLSRSA